jgi:cytochrome c oxidase subunit 4
MADKPHASWIYWIIYAALLLLLAATIGLAFVDFGRKINNSIAMLIACIKGVLIILFFMHMRWERKTTWFFAGAGFLWLGILFVLMSSDYLTRNHPAGGSPKGEPVFITHRER